MSSDNESESDAPPPPPSWDLVDVFCGGGGLVAPTKAVNDKDTSDFDKKMSALSTLVEQHVGSH